MKLSLTLVSIIALAGVAHADNKDKADALFKQGKKLMSEKRYADACEAFEKSNKLDPGIGVQLNLAKCFEEWGKIGRAYLAYQSAEKLAKDTKDDREPKIHEFVVGLEPTVPHLTIRLPPAAPAELKVTLDNRPVETFGEPFVIDPGPHTIEWWVDPSAKKSKIVAIDRGGESDVALELPTPAGAAGEGNTAVTKPGDSTSAKPPGRTQRMAGIALGGLGIVAVGVSSYMTLSARSDYNDALDMYCGGMTNNCDMTGLEITRDARSTANKATVVFLVGVAMVGGGAALYFLAPSASTTGSRPAEKQSFYFTPSVSPDGVGVVLGGRL